MASNRKHGDKNLENAVKLRPKFRVRCIVPGQTDVYVGAEGNRKLTQVPEYEIWLDLVEAGTRDTFVGTTDGSINIRHLTQEAVVAFKCGDEYFVEFVRA